MAESTALMSIGITVTFQGLSGELVDINQDAATTDQADVTHQASADKHREFKNGLTDGGTVTVTMNLNGVPGAPESDNHGSLVITIPGAQSVTMTCDANVAGRGSLDAPLGEKCGTEVTFKLTGKPVWATGA